MTSINPAVGGLRLHKGTEIKLWDLYTEVMASLELTVARQCMDQQQLVTVAKVGQTAS